MGILEKIFRRSESSKKNHIFTQDEKRKHLSTFIRYVDLLCAHLPKCDDLSCKLEDFQIYRSEAEEMVQNGFIQDDLTELSCSVKSIIHLHKEWMPPMIETNSGWTVPDYYPKLEELHEKVMTTARELRAIGEY